MAKSKTVQAEMPPELIRFLRERVAAGRFETEGEMLREGLRLLEAREYQLDTARADLVAKLKRAAAQGERGETVDGVAFMRQLRRKLERQRKRVDAA